CAYATEPSRTFDVYSYGVVLLELITRKRVLVDGNEHIVSWVRSVWDDETNKIDKIVDSYLAASFPNSAVLEKQVTALLSLALRCTERDQRNRPMMIEVVNFYRKSIFKLRCDHMANDNNDGAEVAVGVAPQPPFNNEPDISTNPVSNTQGQGDSYVHEESNEPQDVYALDDLRLVSTPKIGVDGLIIKVIGNGKLRVEQVAVKTGPVVPKVTYTWPYLKFLPTVTGPVVTIPFNWFFLSSWAQYIVRAPRITYPQSSDVIPLLKKLNFKHDYNPAFSQIDQKITELVSEQQKIEAECAHGKSELEQFKQDIANANKQKQLISKALSKKTEARKAELETNLTTNLRRRKRELEAVISSADDDTLGVDAGLKAQELSDAKLNIIIPWLTTLSFSGVSDSISARSKEIKQIKEEINKLKSLEDEYERKLQEETKELEQSLSKKNIYILLKKRNIQRK
ncbi:hypothetical protein S245_058416, partial [Arachis hypogaea]